MSTARIFVENDHLCLDLAGTQLPLQPLTDNLYIAQVEEQREISLGPRIPYRASNNISVAFLLSDQQPAHYLSINANIYKRLDP